MADDTITEKPQATDQQADNIGSSKKDDNSNIGASKASTGRRVSLTSSVRESVRRMSARFSFGRGGRQTDASVETLRGTSGSDFEGYATVHRGDGDGLMNVFDISNLFCCCKEKDGLYFLLIKGYQCVGNSLIYYNSSFIIIVLYYFATHSQTFIYVQFPRYQIRLPPPAGVILW